MARKPRGNVFSRDELIIALDLYLSGLCAMDDTDSLVIKKAAMIGRTPSSLVYKMLNFRHIITGKMGFKHGGQGDKDIWMEFKDNLEGLRKVAEESLDKIIHQMPGLVDDYVTVVGDRLLKIGTGEKKYTLAIIREHQADIRLVALENYRYRCAICDIDIIELLEAAHIKPYANTPEKRNEPSNILCLCALHHRAFDKGIIRFDKDGIVRRGMTSISSKEGRMVKESIISILGKRIQEAKYWKASFAT